MTAEALNQRIATIKKSNAKFLKMTKAEKRVAIAKDVIAQIKSQRLIPKNMEFLTLPTAITLETKVGDMRDVMLATPTCEVCAKGALFVCAVERMNNLTVGQYIIGADREYMHKIFTPKQWGLIECAFEGWSTLHLESKIIDSSAARDFGDKYVDPADRMLAIMRNIIKNDGTFKP